jgi:hypothetical protein
MRIVSVAGVEVTAASCPMPRRAFPWANRDDDQQDELKFDSHD